MQTRLFVPLGLLVVLAVASTHLFCASEPTLGDASYRGLSTAAWQAETRAWMIYPPPCGNGPLIYCGRGRFLWQMAWEAAGLPPRNRHRPGLALLEGDPAALPVLLQLLKSPDVKCRRIAIEGIRRLGEPSQATVEVLKTLLRDKDDDVSLDVAAVLLRSRKITVTEVLESFSDSTNAILEKDSRDPRAE